MSRCNLWFAGAVATATAIAVVHATRTLHPPAGATSFIAVTGGPQIHALGYSYAFMPVGVGALVMLAVALLVNNLARETQFFRAGAVSRQSSPEW